MRRQQRTALQLAGFLAVVCFIGYTTLYSSPSDSTGPNSVPEGPLILAPKRASTREEVIAAAAKNVYPGVDGSHLHGRVGVHTNGSSAWTLLPPLVNETFQQKQEHHKGNKFNLRVSDSISLDRLVRDVRDPACRNLSYPSDLPIASIVFVFHNEATSTLYRSIHSVLNRTPPRFLKEIVLIDDASTLQTLHEPLEQYLMTVPKVKLVRLERRSGLMTARTEGARAATGEVVIFLDSHIECTHGWIEPLLARIKQDRKHVVMPIIDSIDADSFAYGGTGIDILAFSWSLGQTSLSRHRANTTGPWPSVIMAGGLFAIDRKLFFEIGAYDPEMKIWVSSWRFRCPPSS
jgi:hypothetical protein